MTKSVCDGVPCGLIIHLQALTSDTSSHRLKAHDNDPAGPGQLIRLPAGAVSLQIA